MAASAPGWPIRADPIGESSVMQMSHVPATMAP